MAASQRLHRTNHDTQQLCEVPPPGGRHTLRQLTKVKNKNHWDTDTISVPKHTGPIRAGHREASADPVHLDVASQAVELICYTVNLMDFRRWGVYMMCHVRCSTLLCPKTMRSFAAHPACNESLSAAAVWSLEICASARIKSCSVGRLE